MVKPLPTYLSCWSSTVLYGPLDPQISALSEPLRDEAFQSLAPRLNACLCTSVSIESFKDHIVLKGL